MPSSTTPHLRLVERVDDEEDSASRAMEAQVQDFDALYTRYAPYVAAIGLRLLGRDDEVDDLVQEVFLAAYRGWSSIREPEAIRGWLAAVAVRMARRRLRWRRARRFVGLDARPDYERLAPQADPRTRILIGQLFAALDGLGANDRIAWTLRHVEGARFAEIAARCDCSLRTAKRRVARADAFLREVLDDA